MSKTITIMFVCIIFLTFYQEIEGECCHDSINIKYKCKFLGAIDSVCQEAVCFDGELKGNYGYCGVGSCNLFGCNCDGGCRKGTWQSAVENFKRLHPDYVVVVDQKVGK